MIDVELPDRPTVYIDIEATDLHPEHRLAWEIGMVRCARDGTVREKGIFIADVDLSNANEHSLSIGRFYERHPQYRNGFDTASSTSARDLLAECDAARVVEQWTRGAIFAGIVPSFDALTLDRLLRRFGLKSSWHYRLREVCDLAEGWLHGRATTGIALPTPMPSTPEEISLACGVPIPSGDERHTALGDSWWAKRIDDKVRGKSGSPTTSGDGPTISSASLGRLAGPPVHPLPVARNRGARTGVDTREGG